MCKSAGWKSWLCLRQLFTQQRAPPALGFYRAACSHSVKKNSRTAAAAMARWAAASTCAALLILLCALTTAGDLKVEMMAGGTQITPLKDNVTIFCNVSYSQPLNITSMGITWFWKSLMFDKEVKVFEFFGDHQEAFRPGAIVSPWRLKSGDASLQLPGIQLEEAGEYRCEVVVTPLKAQGMVQLEVVAPPVSRLFPDQAVVKENESKYVCESSGFYPEAINITWKKWTQKFPHPIEISEDIITGPTIKNMDGTFNVTSRLKLNSSQEDPGTVYQCVVWHKSSRTSLRNNFTLTAAPHNLSEPEKTDIFSSHWWSISFIGVGLILLIVLFPWKKMCNKSSSAYTPLKCILKHWNSFDTQTLKKEHLVFFCTQAWPSYQLQDGEAWPPEGSININTIQQLDVFCRQEDKWSEVPYVQAFFALRDNPGLCQCCGIDPALLTVTSGKSIDDNSPKSEKQTPREHSDAVPGCPNPSCPPYLESPATTSTTPVLPSQPPTLLLPLQ
ncbi:natural cytotoxicity triggering receptor 3 ligand 1 isoform X1 [Symphalangus syndactylus]|uniref:natural cytotoxicity triggering receptor 3 ligand 1 isoform X1 n=2 Tax=Symphalangus syndactylus TaxID=9590 RepID=UPI0024416B8B|nr:natural cytotoxicity triggering receptor 3 ligand 1 [Symphalangus syndactylus]